MSLKSSAPASAADKPLGSSAPKRSSAVDTPLGPPPPPADDSQSGVYIDKIARR